MRIKKLLVTLGVGLVLMAAAGGAALAKDLDENTQEGFSEISGSIASRYMVEIPAEIEMGTMQRNKETQIPFSITARNVALPDDAVLQVRVSGDGIEDAFVLKSSRLNSQIFYKLFKTDDTKNTEIQTRGVFAEFPGTVSQVGQTQNGYIQVMPSDSANSGIYTGKLNFSCGSNIPTTTTP